MSESVKELVELIHRFVSHQLETNSQLSEAAKESLTVAAECIETAYGIQKKPASNELLDIYVGHKNRSTASSSSESNNPAQFIQNLASSILTTASASVSGNPSQTPSSTTTSSPPTATTQPRVRKNASEAEKMAAESFKNQGNDFMKQDKYQEAHDCYTQAISIDDNNAIYYSNRAAASSKMGDHQAALRDCQESVSIDANYSKAYGRMGLAYASLENHQKAKEAYVRAVELDPHNESYRNNLKIAEEKLAGGGDGSAGGAQNNMLGMIRSMMSNPEVMSMAMRSLQDPRMQNLFGLGGSGGSQASDQTATSGQQQQQQQSNQNQAQTPSQPSPQQQQPSQTETPDRQTSAPQANSAQPPPGPQTPGVNPADLLNLTSRLASTANIDIVGAGQQLLSTIEQSSPELVNNMRRMMNQAFMPPNPDNSDRNPPPGYS